MKIDIQTFLTKSAMHNFNTSLIMYATAAQAVYWAN